MTVVQRHGEAALQTGAGSPFVVVVDESTRTLRIVLATDAPLGSRTDRLPADLSWVSSVVLDLSDPWLVPVGVGTGRERRLEALSAVFQARPDVGRRLLSGRAAWCAVVAASESAGERRPRAGPDGA